MTRYVLILSFLAMMAVALPPRFGGSAAAGRESARAAARAAARSDVPESVHEAADQGRFWRAARLLDAHLAGAPDTAAATVLLAARLHAGWSNWPEVLRLLEDGGDWLDGVEHGLGWSLLGRARIAVGGASAGADDLARYLSGGRSLGPDAQGLAELRRGLALGRAGRADAGLEAIDRAAGLLPWFADWAHYLAAEAAARDGRPAEVNRRLAAAGDAGARGWMLRVGAALAAGDTMAAREASLAATRVGPAGERSAAWTELGRLRLAAGDTARARQALVRAMDTPYAIGAVDAARTLSALGPAPEEWRAVAAVYRRHGNAPRAADAYEAYLAGDIGTPGDRAQADLQLGGARFDAGRYRQAERGLLTLAEGSVPARIAAEALFLAARSQYRQGRAGDGEATFLRLAERFPDQDAVARGLYLVADLKHDDRVLDGAAGARRYYRRAAAASPAVNEAGLALMRLAGLAFQAGDYEEAASVWEEYRRLHPRGRRASQATYWAARSYERLGREAEARQRLEAVHGDDPLSYYGVRAAELLDRPVLDSSLTDGPPRAAAVDSQVEAALRRVDLLAELGRREDLVDEVERLRRRFGAAADAYALAEALNERGYTLSGINIGWELYGRAGDWNRRLLRIVYPFPFRNLVVPEALDRGLDPHLVAGLIRRESAFNPVVVSGAGAIGLMQILPETGRSLARAAGLRSFEEELLTRPEVNVHLGTRFFASLQRRFGESLPLVLAAYNAGPTRAAAWRDLPEAAEPELFTERIPYAETRDYVRNVIAHRALYRALYPELGAAGPEAAGGEGAAGGASDH